MHKKVKKSIKNKFKELSSFYEDNLFNDNIIESKMLNIQNQIFENIILDDKI